MIHGLQQFPLWRRHCSSFRQFLEKALDGCPRSFQRKGEFKGKVASRVVKCVSRICSGSFCNRSEARENSVGVVYSGKHVFSLVSHYLSYAFGGFDFLIYENVSIETL